MFGLMLCASCRIALLTGKKKLLSRVYGNSFLTIAASKARSCNSRLLKKRGEPEFKVTDGLVHARPPRHSNGYPGTRTGQEVPPLETRGWAFQEYLLSPRVLHFASDEMVWHCNKEPSCECRFESAMVSGKLSISTHSRASLRKIIESELSSREIDQVWHRCVEQYSQRQFTRQSDVLPALSGVARIFEDKKNARYFAGIWDSSKLHDLCWRRLPTPQPTLEKDTHEDENGYICPLWPWPAARGPILFRTIDEYRITAQNLQMEIINASTTPPIYDPFGKVPAGFLVIHSWSFQVSLAIRDDLSISRVSVDEENDAAFREILEVRLTPGSTLDRLPTRIRAPTS